MIEYTPMHQTESANRIEYMLVHFREAEADLFERGREAAKADGIRGSRFGFANCMSKLSDVGSDRL